MNVLKRVGRLVISVVLALLGATPLGVSRRLAALIEADRAARSE